MPRKKKTELTIAVLKRTGRITEATGHAVHGRYHVAGAIYRLRTVDRHLIPTLCKITTHMKEDVNGNPYAEWRLERKAA